MLVHQILKDKPEGGVVTVRSDQTVSDVIDLLSARKFGAVIVSDDTKVPLGIVSERDIVREIGRNGIGVLDKTVAEIMTRDLVVCSREENAVDVLQTMTNGRFRHMPVMNGNEMIGLISIGDVVKGRLSELAMEKDALEGMIMGH